MNTVTVAKSTLSFMIAGTVAFYLGKKLTKEEFADEVYDHIVDDDECDLITEDIMDDAYDTYMSCFALSDEDFEMIRKQNLLKTVEVTPEMFEHVKATVEETVNKALDSATGNIVELLPEVHVKINNTIYNLGYNADMHDNLMALIQTEIDECVK